MAICETHDFVGVIQNANLSTISKRQYLQRLKMMMQHLQKDIFWILKHPKEGIAWIRSYAEAHTSQKSFVNAVLAVFKHCPDLKTQEKASFDQWYAAFSEVDAKIEERYKSNEPSERQREGYVAFPEIVKKRDALEPGSNDRLLLSMYTHLPPLRADFNRVRIYTNEPKKGDSEGEDDDREDNYIVLGGRPRLVLHEFKTKRHREHYEKDLPKPLLEEIRASLKRSPREWLFRSRDGKPYSANSYTKWANGVLARLFGRPLTISLIRHSFINTLDFNTLTVHEKEQIAKDMSHTVATQDRYRLIFRDKQTEKEKDASHR